MIGKSSLQVLINDREVLLSGKNLSDYLKTISSDNIKSIEVISNPPAKYDAEGNSGIVNIVLKKANSNFWNATFTEDYRQGEYATNNNGASFNFNKNRLSFTSSASYGFGNTHYLNNSQYFYPNEYWNDKISSVNINNFFTARIGIDYKITDKFTIGGIYNYSYQKNKYNDNDRTLVTGNSDYDLIETPATRNGKSNFNMANLHGTYTLDTSGRKLSFDFNYLSFDDDNNNFFNTSYFLKNQLEDNSKANNLGMQRIDNYSILVDMEQPTKFINWNYGGKLSFSKTDNNIFYYDLSSGSPIIDSNNSNHFIYKENNEVLYFSASKKFDKKWEAKAGLRMETTQTEGNSLTNNEIDKQNYTKLFPTAYLSYNIGNDNSITLNYGRRIQRPNFSYLNPFRWYSNPLAYSTGDPPITAGIYTQFRVFFHT